MKNPHDFTCNVTVRFKDIDAMGHVNNAVVLTYLSGRVRLLERVNRMRDDVHDD